MTKNLITLIVLFILTTNCNKDEQTSNFQGEYQLIKITSDKPVKYTQSGNLTKDLTDEIPCNSSLIFGENNQVQEDFIFYEIESYQITIGVGITDFSPTICHTSRANGILVQNNESNLKIEFTPNTALWTVYKANDTLKVITYASLIHQDDDGILKKGSVELRYNYLK